MGQARIMSEPEGTVSFPPGFSSMLGNLKGKIRQIVPDHPEA